jgi:hypothetical protein
MSKNLPGYTTIDKSLSGVITISDGAGTTISGGVITTNTINVTDLNATNINSSGGGLTASQITSTATATDGTKYRFVFTSNSSTNPKSLLTDGLLYQPSTNVLEAAALRVFSSINNTAITQTDYFPLYFGLGTVANGGNYVYQASNMTYRPSTDTLTSTNINFTNLNGVSGFNFNTNMTNVPLIYDGLGGNSASGLPVFSSAYNQVIFPTNQRTYGGYVVDGGSYFGGASNIFGYNRFENDPSFNLKNFFQIAFSGAGTTYNGGTTNVGVSGIDFNCWDGRDHSSARIYSRDNGNYSADMLFATAPSFFNSYSTERMRIMADGNIGIGTSAPSEMLDVGGTTKTTALAVGNIYAISPTTTTNVFSEKTSGSIKIGDNNAFTGTISIGNSSASSGTVRLYGANGYLSGLWNAPTPTAGNNSTLIATTAFVQSAVSSSASGAVQLTSTTSQSINSTLAVTGRLLTNTPYPYAVVGSGTNQYDNVITNDTGNIVFTFATGGKTVYSSYDGGVSWSAIYTSANVINNVSCTNSGKYVAIGIASLASQVSSNYGATFTALSITGLTVFYPLTYISIAESIANNGFFYVCFAQCNTSVANRVDFYMTNGGFAGTFVTSTLAGNTAYAPQFVWADILVNPCIIYIGVNNITAYQIPSGTVGAITYALYGILGSPTSVGNMKQVKTNYGNSYSSFVQITTSSGLYQSSNGGAINTFTNVLSSSATASGCSRAGNILVYTQTAIPYVLYISNNQYVSAIGTTPSYSFLYTPSGLIKDIVVSGNGQKIYFTITGQLDKIYQISLQGVFSSYLSDFITDKERTIVRAKPPADTLGTFYDVLIPYKIQQVNFAVTLTLPFAQYYSLNGTTGFTVTLPRIQDYMVGLKIEFFNTGVKTTSLAANTNDCVISPSSPIVYTVTSYSLVASATVNSVRLLVIPCPNTTAKEYAWLVC